MMANGDLKFFTQTPILRRIGHRRLAKFLTPFDEEVKSSRLALPQRDPEDDDYFADLANALVSAQSLPPNLRQALFTLEEAALPQNYNRVWSAIKRRFPGLSVSEDCALDRALDLWFVAPDEFSRFVPALDCLKETGSAELNRRDTNDTESEKRAATSADVASMRLNDDEQTIDRLARPSPCE